MTGQKRTPGRGIKQPKARTGLKKNVSRSRGSEREAGKEGKRMTLRSNWVVMALFLETETLGEGQVGSGKTMRSILDMWSSGNLGHLGRAISWESGYTAYVKRYLLGQR